MWRSLNIGAPLSPAPSAPPVSVTSSNVAPNSFSIQWQTVPCVHQNGDITGYSVQYGVQGKEGVENTMIAGSDNLTITLNRLEPETTYLVQVAGVNAQGVGDYRNLTVSTPQSGFDAATNTHKCTCKHLPTCTHRFVQPLSLKIPITFFTAVYLNFGGMNLPKNGYMTISQLGSDTDTGLVCRTDQSGDSSGSWFNPSGTKMDGDSSICDGFYISSGDDGLYLLRGSGIPVEGIYTCRATDSFSNNRTVSVGIYNESRGIHSITISVSISYAIFVPFCYR